MVEDIVQGAEVYVRDCSRRVTLGHLYTCNIASPFRAEACTVVTPKQKGVFSALAEPCLPTRVDCD